MLFNIQSIQALEVTSIQVSSVLNPEVTLISIVKANVTLK